MSAKREYAWGKVIEWTFFSLSCECKMKLGLREKRIRTDEQFGHGILTPWEMGSHSLPILPSLPLLGNIKPITEINRVEVHFGSIT